jgi:hypothetical protein
MGVVTTGVKMFPWFPMGLSLWAQAWGGFSWPEVVEKLAYWAFEWRVGGDRVEGMLRECWGCW